MKTVLYVEDNDFNLELIRQVFRDHEGVNFTFAMDGPSGLEKALSEIPDLILLDINLPGMNGREVLKRLKAEKTTAHIPVIAISADALSTQIEESMGLGFVDYITKPINLKEFLDKVDSFLGDDPAADSANDSPSV